ncbi:DNase I-like protein [Glarea lozoyensis ATCC 20868]|uniref:phosphoinositide 5-phosphatase n=1 Tax=Glarea lozoyensis (strain ATCC 20868 / MF5171) TaxID=1116229 RepID=S3CVW2_GLAL2|nr:DNase I-like protein [Glarea lozoyensis ATCC 20868]EPE29084.1 DNase I-like protein [Glarea lozoyensis ATCC 20868]
MSIRVLISDYPHRSIALVTPSHALIFRYSPSASDATHNGSRTSIQSLPPRTSTDGSAASRCMVEFVHAPSADLSDYRTLHPTLVHGTLGLITINNDVFISVVTLCEKVATVRPGETIQKIKGVDFYCLNSSDYDHIFSDNLDPYAQHAQDYTQREPLLEHPTLALKNLLSEGSFYYSTDFDLTNRLQDRSTEAALLDIDNLDESFLWNSYMIDPLVKFRSRLVAHEREALDSSGFLTSAIRGYAATFAIPSSSAPLRTSRVGMPSTLTLISRLSCRKAGTRFNSRGIDDDGNVANFVESETVYWSPSAAGVSEPGFRESSGGICFSYAQIRGSVPVFWEQATTLLPGQQKITVTRSAEGTQPAFDKHFGELEQNYGAVHIVNLLSASKPGEAELTTAYQKGIKFSPLNDVGGNRGREHHLLEQTVFDFHAETKGPKGYETANLIRRHIGAAAEGFAYYLSEEMDESDEHPQEKSHKRTVVVLQQEGVFRTNCLDCLDRTNLIQTIISRMAVETFLGHRGENAASDFWSRHSSLWADNGDALSRIYAGTGALKSSYTRSGKMSIGGVLSDIRKSTARTYINTFLDKGRQENIDILLGKLVGQTPVHLFDPINDYVAAELAKRSSEYQSSDDINIWCGTYNLNGKTTGIDQDLSSWLAPQLEKSQQNPEIVAVGFQEIVELSPQQIMNSDPTQKQKWEKAVRRTLNKHAVAGERYVLLRSGQLVGAALCIFAKSSVLKNIKNVEGAIKKTGMSGMAGNKGAVAIRLDYAKTHICFVTAHLAAGFANYEERNRDYVTIHHGLRFQRNRGIDDHDTVIWMGDFNYRIGLGADKVKSLIKMGDLETLYENDQLNLQMVAGLTFPFYSESRITFEPTYKYDLGTDTYDTSEKARIPAWTDRILRKGTNLRQINYNTAPLRFSDHRPVYATFQCTVSIVDEAIKEALSHEIYERKRSEVGHPTINDGDDDSEDEDLIGYDSIEPSLPPASSDQRKWWLDNGQPARSAIKPPKDGMVPNPNRPSNPFTPTDESDWVQVPRNPTPQTQTAPQPPGPRQNGRKLPPPFQKPESSVNELVRNISTTSLTQSSPRRQSTASLATSSSSKKAAPPVARKPLHLTASPSSPTLDPKPTSVNAFSSPRSRPETAAFPPPPRRNTAGTVRKEVNSVPAPPQPRRQGKLVKRDSGRDVRGMGYRDEEEQRPSLPPRRPTVDLLGGDAELEGWKSLT